MAAAGFPVIAIEAIAVNQFALRMSMCANQKLNGTITLIPAALGHKNELCAVYTQPFNILNGNVRCGSSDTLKALEKQDSVFEKRQDVQISRLDDLFRDWIPSLAGRVGALKIDTEGVEPFVFRGGSNFFSTVKPDYMQMEISRMNELATGVTPAKLLHWVEMFGYTVHEHVDGPPVEPNNIVFLTSGPQNVFLSAKDL